MNENRKKRILCLGDSNTFGYDPHASFGGRYGEDVRWTARLQAAGWQVFNGGMNGAVVPGAGEDAAVASLIQSRQPLDAITVMYGTNDVLRGADAAETAARMERFLPLVRANAQHAAVLLVAPPPVTWGDWVQSAAVIRASEALSTCYQAIAAAQGAVFADAGAWGVSLSFDGVHFTPEGHAAFFRGLLGALEYAP